MCNVGNLDHLVRLVLGVTVFLMTFAAGWNIWATVPAKYGVAAIGAVLTLTSVFRFCPPDHILGVNTCRL